MVFWWREDTCLTSYLFYIYCYCYIIIDNEFLWKRSFTLSLLCLYNIYDLLYTLSILCPFNIQYYKVSLLFLYNIANYYALSLLYPYAIANYSTPSLICPHNRLLLYIVVTLSLYYKILFILCFYSAYKILLIIICVVTLPIYYH